MPDSSQVGCAVAEAAVRLPHDHRQRLTVASDKPRQERAGRTLGLRQQTVPLKLVHNHWQVVVVRALADNIIPGQRRAEPRVHLLEVGQADVHHPLPTRPGRRITGLQRNDPQPGQIGEVAVTVEVPPAPLVQLLKAL